LPVHLGQRLADVLAEHLGHVTAEVLLYHHPQHGDRLGVRRQRVGGDYPAALAQQFGELEHVDAAAFVGRSHHHRQVGGVVEQLEAAAVDQRLLQVARVLHQVGGDPLVARPPQPQEVVVLEQDRVAGPAEVEAVVGHLDAAQQLVDPLDLVDLPGEGGAEDRPDRDRVLVDQRLDLFGPDRVPVGGERDHPLLDVEVFGELLPAGVHVGAEDDVRLGAVVAAPLAPAPLVGEQAEHDRLQVELVVDQLVGGPGGHRMGIRCSGTSSVK
jgi:hypothetical protein